MYIRPWTNQHTYNLNIFIETVLVSIPIKVIIRCIKNTIKIGGQNMAPYSF